MEDDERRKLIQELAGRHFLSGKPVAGRANSSAQKRQVIERIYVLWEENPKMRLGQLILNAYHDDLFHVEDFALLDEIEDWYGSRKTL
jgi:hypothetical protein